VVGASVCSREQKEATEKSQDYTWPTGHVEPAWPEADQARAFGGVAWHGTTTGHAVLARRA
jgi:hypothetical protein